MTAVRRSIGEQFDVVCSHLNSLVKNCKGLHDYLKKYLQLEKDYGQGLQKLTKTATGRVQFLGGLGGGWLASVQVSTQVADHRLQAAERMLELGVKPLARIFDGGDLDKARKQLLSEGRRYNKEMDQAVQRFQKAKANYISAAQEWMSVLLALHREHGDIWAPSATKLRDKETALCKKCNEAKMVYLSEVSAANVVQHAHYFERMPQVLANSYQVSQDIVSVASSSLKHLRQHNDRTMDKELAQSFEALSDWSPLNLDVQQYVADFIACHVPTNNVAIPPPYVFEEFLMEDEAAKIHARKVQYEIIKCFPSASALGMHAKAPGATDERSSREGSPAEALREVTQSMSAAQGDVSVSSMLDLRQALVRRGRQLFRNVFGGDEAAMGQQISDPVLQPWPYNLEADRRSSTGHQAQEAVVTVPDEVCEADLDVQDKAPFVIRCCVDYLNQPKMLKEEGLFRVPGDMTRIQQLNAGFLADETSKGQNQRLRSFLKGEIAKELNPNVVAGLLKLHLREIGCLSAGNSAELQKLVQAHSEQSDEFSLKVQDILQNEPKRNQSALKLVISLLKKIEENSAETKMTAHAIAVSCGLSVFPLMETGSSIKCLKLFLIHFGDLY
eukprot:m.29935 g.29935  ORF g.29935 m.29935 type:complete len:614 (+) comp31265_c0_seq3:16-1857(+)